jgi:hypothetical protein
MHLANAFDVPPKGGEVLLQALRVSYVCKHTAKPGHAWGAMLCNLKGVVETRVSSMLVAQGQPRLRVRAYDALLRRVVKHLVI